MEHDLSLLDNHTYFMMILMFNMVYLDQTKPTDIGYVWIFVHNEAGHFWIHMAYSIIINYLIHLSLYAGISGRSPITPQKAMNAPV